MSIEVNGVTYPDLPEDRPAPYHYATILSLTDSGVTSVVLCLSAGSMVDYNSAGYMSLTNGYTIYALSSTNTWTLSSTDPNDPPMFMSDKITIIATNYMVFYLPADDNEADLGKITFERNIWPQSIEPPSAPQDFIYSYPYAAVFRVHIDTILNAIEGMSSPDEGLLYAAMLSSGPIYYWDDGKQSGIVSFDNGNISYVLDPASMTWIEEMESEEPIMAVFDDSEELSSLFYIDLKPLWSNHNIETIVGADDNGDPIISDIYFEGSETVTPIDYYAISRLKLLGMAQQARRHNSFSVDPLTMADMAPIFSSIAILDDAEEVAY